MSSFFFKNRKKSPLSKRFHFIFLLKVKEMFGAKKTKDSHLMKLEEEVFTLENSMKILKNSVVSFATFHISLILIYIKNCNFNKIN